MTEYKSINTCLRSRQWFNDSSNPEMTGIYLERYLNYGLTREELQSDKPIIGIAQTGSDLSPCNRHHLELARRIRDGIIAAGGTPIEFPVHPIQETGKRPTASLDRNLAYLGLVECLHGYPIDGVVLTIGCDKTTPALLMAASTVNIPAIAFSVGPMLNGYFRGQRSGSGSIVWTARNLHAAGEIDDEGFMDLVTSSAPSVGYCNTMGTASTMNLLAEALGMQLPGSASIPAPYRERGQMAYATGKQIVTMVRENLKPSDVMTLQSFENAVVINSALGGSSNAPIHLNAIARHLGLKLTNDDWQRLGYDIPLLVNMQPAGQYLSEDFYRAGGVPSVIGELIAAGCLPHLGARTVNGASIGENYSSCRTLDINIISTVDKPLQASAGFINFKGNLFDSALMKTSVISPAFRKRYLSDPARPNIFDVRVIVFDGPEIFHQTIDDPALQIDEDCVLVMRGVGPIGYPGAAEVVNMRPPNYLIKKGVISLPCIGDGRQSGTSGSPSILNASPEAAAGGGLGLLLNGDYIRIDLNACTVNVLLDDAALAARAKALAEAGGYRLVESQTPWQEYYRSLVQPLSDGMVLRGATFYRNIANIHQPRHNH
ncbi:MAG: IlvD/Edd family dehydratase [Balneolales bacterium]